MTTPPQFCHPTCGPPCPALCQAVEHEERERTWTARPIELEVDESEEDENAN